MIGSNRTTVGLKPEAANAHLLAAPFKSHHCGIETCLRTFGGVVKMTFKSHHCGIETFPIHAGGDGSGSFKSHHCGIETPTAKGAGPIRAGSNRTTVGLKQNRDWE